jgi:hypothetical protein
MRLEERLRIRLRLLQALLTEGAAMSQTVNAARAVVTRRPLVEEEVRAIARYVEAERACSEARNALAEVLVRDLPPRLKVVAR